MLFSRSKSILRGLTLLSALTFIIPLAAKDKNKSPYPKHASVFVPYENAASNTELSKSPTINLGFNESGTHVPFIMDTGSVGIVASADIFTPAHDAKNLGPGQQYYTSSGIIEVGTWWTATQQIYDANGNLVATAEVPVLRVTSIQCAPDARSCTPNNDPTGISVMGIGFARESPQQPLGTPEYNAFLNLKRVEKDGKLKKLPKKWCNGYVVCPNGVFLGLSSDNTANTGFVKLLPWPQYSTKKLPEWQPAPMTFDANGTDGDGNILMDTGVDTAFLSPPTGADVGSPVSCPDNSSLVECAPDGDVFAVYLPNSTNPVAYYTFTVGETGNLMQPNGVHLVDDSDVFFNTSRHVLGGINFLYDNTNGYIGYTWNGQSGSDVGYVHPATACSKTTLMASPNPVKVGRSITFTATVLGARETEAPTGGVTFKFHDTLTYVPLDNYGQATFTLSNLAKGKHTIKAEYSGDSTYMRSSSSKLVFKVKKKG